MIAVVISLNDVVVVVVVDDVVVVVIAETNSSPSTSVASEWSWANCTATTGKSNSGEHSHFKILKIGFYDQNSFVMLLHSIASSKPGQPPARGPNTGHMRSAKGFSVAREPRLKFTKQLC